MTTRSFWVYEHLTLAEQAKPEPKWKRSRFSKRRDLTDKTDPVTRETARLYLEVIMYRWPAGTRFRLVRITEELGPDEEIPSYD